MQALKFFIGFLFISQLCFSQVENRPVKYDDTEIEKQSISEDDLKTYKENEAFNYVEKEADENFLDKIYRWLNNLLREFWEAIFGVGTASGFLYFVFRVLPYLLLAFLIFLLIRFFVKVNSKNVLTNSKSKGKVDFTEEEQIIKNEDIPELIKNAIEQKNYRLAIRYHYLLSLKYLIDNKNINWQPQKTNTDYINEIEINEIKISFQNITKIYDYVWYGEFSVNDLKFESLRKPFENLNQSILNS